MMYPAVGYKHQHNYSHEDEDYYAQNSYNYSSMQMMRPKPSPPPHSNYMISSPQPSECHVAAMTPGGGGNKDKYYENKEKYYESFNAKEKYQDGGYGHYDNHNKDKYYEEKFNEGGFREKYQDGYGHYENRNKDKYFENKEKFNEGFHVKENYQDGYGHYDSRNKDKYHENKEKFHEGTNYARQGSDNHYYGHGHGQNGSKHQEGGYKLSMDKLMSGGGYGAETHFVTPHMRRPYDHHEKRMDSWEFKSIDD